MMNLIVCVKQVIDPEISPALFVIDDTTNELALPHDILHVVDPYSAHALEAALKIKEESGGKVTVLSLGNNLHRDVIKKPLAMGADELILLEDEAFEGGDSWATAQALSAAIKKIAEFDIIFFGREASDWNDGQTGLGVAEILGLSSVTLAQKVDVIDGKIIVERLTDEGYEKTEVGSPTVITVSHEIGEPRYASVRGVMAAKKIEPTVWKPADIGLDSSQVGAAGRRTRSLKLFRPVREGSCEIVEGESQEEMGENLAVTLKEAKII